MMKSLLIAFCLFLRSLPAQAAQDELELSANYQMIHAEGLLRSIDITLVGVTNLFSYGENEEISGLIVHDSLNRHVDRVPGLRALFVTDAQGTLRHDSLKYPTRKLDLSDRSYISQALSQRKGHLYIGKPLPNRFSNFKSLPLSRPIFNRRGHVTGVAAAIMTPDHLIQRSQVCKKCVVSIFRKDGAKIASFPADVQAQPDIHEVMKRYPSGNTFDITVRQLETKSVWLPFTAYDLILLYSNF